MEERRRQGRPNFDDDDEFRNDVISNQTQSRRMGTEDPSAAIDKIVNTTLTVLVKKVWASPKTKVGLLLWIIGFCFMVFAPPLTTVTPEMHQKYGEMIHEASNIFQLDDAKAELSKAQADVYNNQVWFWRFRSPHREIVEEKQKVLAVVQQKYDELQAVRAEKMKKANAYVGIWSEYGMQDMRESFWSAFESGKVFATRQTFWQILFSSREENLMAQLLQWIITALINFTLGLLGSLFYFTFSLGSLIFSYEAGTLSGIAFYVIALLGGASLVATYLFAIYGLAAGTIYTVGKMAVTNAIKNQERERARLQGQQRRHEHSQ